MHPKYLYITGSIVGAITGWLSSFITHTVNNINTVESMSSAMVKLGYMLSAASVVIGVLIGLIVALIVHKISKL